MVCVLDGEQLIEWNSVEHGSTEKSKRRADDPGGPGTTPRPAMIVVCGGSQVKQNVRVLLVQAGSRLEAQNIV
jgi:hypothetical protein